MSDAPHFDVSLNLGDFGPYQAGVTNSLTAAVSNIGRYLDANGTFDLSVLPTITDEHVLASTNPTLIATPNALVTAEHGASASTAFGADSLSAADTDPGQTDATVYINMADVTRLDMDPAAGAADQYDLTTILTHEILHAIGFTGLLGQGLPYQTAFDGFIVFQDGNPYFTGPAAEGVYGGPVPLVGEAAGPGSAYYHVAIANDLMSAAIGPGETRAVSTLDLAMLKDVGVPEVTMTGVPDTPQTV